MRAVRFSSSETTTRSSPLSTSALDTFVPMFGRLVTAIMWSCDFCWITSSMSASRQRLRAFENGAGDFDHVHGQPAGRALHRRVADGDLAREFDTHLRFKVGCDGVHDLVEQLGFAIGALRRVGQEHVGDLAQQFAALLARSFLREIQKQGEIAWRRRHGQKTPLGQLGKLPGAS